MGHPAPTLRCVRLSDDSSQGPSAPAGTCSVPPHGCSDGGRPGSLKVPGKESLAPALDQGSRSSATALANRDHAARHTEAQGSSGIFESRMTTEHPFRAISTQLLPDASDEEDLTHFNSDKTSSSYRSLAISRIRSLEFFGSKATCSTASRRRRKLASWVGESKKTAPMGVST